MIQHMKPFRSLLTGNFRFSNVDDFSLAREGVYVQVLLHDEGMEKNRTNQTRAGSVPNRIVPAPAGVVVVVVVPGVPEVAIVVIGV